MCNLYRMTKNTDEVAKWFGALDAAKGVNFAEELYPGCPGLVVADGNLAKMIWGFPLVSKGKSGQPLKPKPVNNARTDRLESFFWRDSFEQRRCLIPISAWAEAQGAKGAMTRTWMSLPDADVFAVAGVWRESDEFGTCYAMVMTNSAGSRAASVHSRMPVLLTHGDYDGWVSGSPQDARVLCKSWSGDLNIDRTNESWVKGRTGQKSLF
jgi:putative SOS response-associated peptidase YedK